MATEQTATIRVVVKSYVTPADLALVESGEGFNKAQFYVPVADLVFDPVAPAVGDEVAYFGPIVFVSESHVLTARLLDGIIDANVCAIQQLHPLPDGRFEYRS